MKAEDYVIDETGFVMIFIGKPYWYKLQSSGKVWCHYWHIHQKSWVTLREVSYEEMRLAYLEKVDLQTAKIYHDLHNQTFGGAPEIKLN